MATFRTKALGHVVDAGQGIARRQLNGGDGHVGETEGAMAALAVEVNVLVVILDVAVVAVAQLVAHAVAAVLNDMHKVVFAKQRQGTEHARLVD